MVENYKYDPIQEALCEFRFAPGALWNPTIPGKISVQAAKEYDGEPREVTVNEVTVLDTAGNSNVSMKTNLDRVQLINKGNNRILAIGPGVVSVHSIAPYEGWDESFKARILSSFDMCSAYMGKAPVIRIGLRYINRLSVTQEVLDPNPYFTVQPIGKHALEGATTNFQARIEQQFDDGHKLIVTYTALPKTGEISEFILDLDTIWDKAPLSGISEIEKKLEELHSCEKQAFESLITDEARKIFNGG